MSALNIFRFNAIDRYVARGFLVLFAVVLAVIVVLLQTLDLMNAAEEVLAAEGAGAAQILRYISLRAPQLIDRFAPFVALMAGLLCFARLSQSSEIIAMRASGMSPLRILAPACAVAAAIALAHFAFHELVVVRGSAELDRWSAQDYALDAAPGAEPLANIRMADGNQIVRADRMVHDGEAWRLENLRAYVLGQGGVAEALRGDARHDGAAWRVTGAQSFEAADRNWRAAGDMVWARGPAPERIVAASLNPEHARIGELRLATQAAEWGAPRLETAMLHRFFAPIATIIMPLLAGIAGFGLHRTNSLLPRIAAGLALGFAYFVVDNFMVVMGRLDAAPPVLAVMAAPLLFLGLGLAMRR